MSEHFEYFKPELSDVRIGYECEWKDTRGDWTTFKVECPHDIMTAFDDELRTPYLTKEQIEAEGWVYKESEHNVRRKVAFFEKKSSNLFLIADFALTPCFLRFSLRDPSIEQRMPDPERFAVCLNCPDINTFRQICKLIE